MNPASLKSAAQNIYDLTLAELTQLTYLLDNTSALTVMDTSVKKTDELIKDYQVKLNRITTSKEALDQQFIDERKTPSQIKTPKVRLLQDYILAAFTVSYICASLVSVAYFTANAEWWPSGLLLSGGSVTVLGGVIYSLVLNTA